MQDFYVYIELPCHGEIGYSQIIAILGIVRESVNQMLMCWDDLLIVSCNWKLENCTLQNAPRVLFYWSQFIQFDHSKYIANAETVELESCI